MEKEKEPFKKFIRISWSEAEDILRQALHEKYNANGKIILQKNYGYEGIGLCYDLPEYVDIELE